MVWRPTALQFPVDPAMPTPPRLVRSARAENLLRLLRELDNYVSTEPVCQERRAERSATASSFGASVPLSHSRGAASFRTIARDGVLLSRSELERAGVALAKGNAERTLQTSDDVFTYVGAFRYPSTSCGFFFKPEMERTGPGRAVATPFDSGAILKHLKPRDDGEDRVAFLRRHEMPVPEYREYFQHYLRLLFSSPWDYIEGNGPDVVGPIPLDGGDSRRWTFEVRFKKEVPLAGVLMAVILPVVLAATMTREIAIWKRSGVHVRYYMAPDPAIASEWRSLHEASISYLKEWLR